MGLSLLSPRGELVSVSPSPIKVLLDEERRRIVHESMDEFLTEREREVIILTYWQMKSIKEIADFMKITQQAAKQCRYRAIKKLRNCPKLINYLFGGS